MMTQIRKQRPVSPRQAARRKAAIDHELDARLFRALSDPTRLRLLSCLAKCGRGCSVTEVAACCDVDFSVVSRHLALLAGAGVVESQKDGRIVRYRVRFKDVSRALRELADAFDECCPTDGESGCGPDDCCT